MIEPARQKQVVETAPTNLPMRSLGVRPMAVRTGWLAATAKGSGSKLRGFLLPLAILGGWQLITSLHLVEAAFLPSPSEVASAWWTWAFGQQTPFTWTSGTFVEFSLLSIRRVFLGYAIGASIGLALGILIGWYSLASDLFDPFIQALRPIPMTAWLPFATLVFGVQEPAAIYLIAMGCFFPVVVNTAAGARQTPQLLVRAALMLGTKPYKVLLRVVIPSAMPSIVTGLRLGLGIAWVLMIVAEMLAVKGGLGFAVWSAYTFLRMDLILAAIVTMGVYGWATDRLLVIAASRLMRWQRGLVRQ
jgi:NitT/TauT family transport system permease protein